MTENRMEERTCEVCKQSFNSDRELQEHQKDSHSPGQQSGRDQDQQRREKIADSRTKTRRAKIVPPSGTRVLLSGKAAQT